MGFEMIVKIAHSSGVWKQQKVASRFKVERKQTVQDTNIFIRSVTSIPNINKHDENTVLCIQEKKSLSWFQRLFTSQEHIRVKVKKYSVSLSILPKTGQTGPLWSGLSCIFVLHIRRV